MPHDERRFNPQHRHVLLDSQRQARWDPPLFLARFELKAGQTVLDLGCGPGFWTLPLAEIIGPTGAVWALDVSEEMLQALAACDPPGHVHLLQGELPDIHLPDACVDFVWAAFIFHEVEPPGNLATELRRVTHKEGCVAVLEWRPDAVGDDGPPRDHRLWPEQVSAHLRAAGFQTVARTWQDEDAYLIEANYLYVPETV